MKPYHPEEGKCTLRLSLSARSRKASGVWTMLQSLLPEMLPPTAVVQQVGEVGPLVSGVSLRCLGGAGPRISFLLDSYQATAFATVDKNKTVWVGQKIFFVNRVNVC